MIINQQVNKNITKEEYFNDKHVIEVNDLNIKVEVYSHDLRRSKVAKIESEIRETATNFKMHLSCSLVAQNKLSKFMCLMIRLITLTLVEVNVLVLTL